MTANEMFNKAFHRPREARSDEYKAGVMAILEFRLGGEKPECPYRRGTAQADAWYAGGDEGHAIYREEREAA